MVSSGAKKKRYVDGHAGWRLFLFAVILSAISGLAFRLYFNPARIQTWVEAAIIEQSPAAEIRFQQAALRLSRGAWPYLAIEISGVEVTTSPGCGLGPGLQVERLWIPISFSSVFSGRVTIGTIEGEGVVADIDALKARCPKPAENGGRPLLKESLSEQASAGSSQSARWWTPELMAEVQRTVKGLQLTKVEVFFEKKTKNLYLGNLHVRSHERDGFYLKSELSIPPELVFGERLPLLSVEADVVPDSADVKIRAGLDEGELTAVAALRPTSDGGLDAKINASVRNVPLSTLAPLAVRSGIFHGTFQPRFLWMNCRAEISGPFQGLLEKSPLYFEDCEIVGGGDSRIKVAKATRFPNGDWAPVRFEIRNVDMRRLMSTFGWQGAEIVFDDYGQLYGELEIPVNGEGKFQGTIRNSIIRFSSRSQLAFQKLKQLRTTLHLKAGRLRGTLDGFEFEGGNADGTIDFTLIDDLKRGEARAVIRSLRFDDTVQILLFGGPLESVAGNAEALFRDGRLVELTSVLRLRKLEGRDFRFDDAVAKTEMDPTTDEFRLHFQTPELRVSKNSKFASSARTLFFNHEFSGDWVPVHDFRVRARFMKAGGLLWELLQGSLEDGHIHIESVGQFTRDHLVTGWVMVDYPAVRRLRWRLSGYVEAPLFSDDSEALMELRRMPEIDDKVLGLPERKKAL